MDGFPEYFRSELASLGPNTKYRSLAITVLQSAAILSLLLSSGTTLGYALPSTQVFDFSLANASVGSLDWGIDGRGLCTGATSGSASGTIRVTGAVIQAVGVWSGLVTSCSASVVEIVATVSGGLTGTIFVSIVEGSTPGKGLVGFGPTCIIPGVITVCIGVSGIGPVIIR